MNSKRRRAPAGFTIVELVLSIVIIGLLATMAVWHFGTLTAGSALRAEVERLRAHIYELRDRSLTADDSQRIVFDLDNGSYELQMDLTGGSPSVETVLLDSAVAMTATSFPSDTLDFRRGGRIVSAGGLVLEAGGEVREVLVTEESGYVVIR